MIKIFKHLRSKEWSLILASLVLIIFQIWLDLKLPDYMAEITKLVQTPGSEMSDIFVQGGYMLVCAFGSLLSSAVVGYFSAVIAASFSRRIRKTIFNKVESFSMEEINKFSTPSLITRSTNDVTQIQTFIATGLQVIVKAPILAVWAILKISGKNWEWMAVTAGSVGFLLIVIAIVIIFVIPKFKVVQKLTDNLNKVTRENLSGIRVVRAYNSEKYQEERFELANNNLTKVNMFSNKVMAIMSPSMSLVMNGLSLLIYWIGAHLINQANIMDRLNLFSDMIVFSSYAMQVIIAFLLLSFVFIILPRATVSAKRINEILNTHPKIRDGKIDTSPSNIKGEIEFKNVGFKYPDASEYVIKNISFKVHQGETIAFIGSTGSGKSTLVNLIPRFYDVTEGEILFDGINIKDYTLKELRSKVGYIPQKAVLFSGTVESNVAYGERNGKHDIPQNQIEKSIEIAQAKEFVDKMEGRLKARISQGGTNISGGQKQRMSIARAVFRNPEIYIFDDSFSALDYRTDRRLREILKKETKNITNIIVAQRIGTIKNADKIVVMEKGEIVGMGSHKELLNSCDVYKEIAYSQLSKEELENE